MKGPELVFLHIPKTAGTSQQTMFNEYYGPENLFWIGKDCDPDIRRYPADRIAGHGIVGGHKRLAFYPRAINPVYCALVRDPVARAISLFVYYTRPELAISPRDRKIREGLIKLRNRRGLDPDSMVESIRNCRSFRREISNYQCRYLSRGRATFAGVQRSLRDYDFIIGSVAAYRRFHVQLAQLLDWVEEPPLQVNRSRDDYAREFLRDPALVAMIAELNREDEKLVRWVDDEHRGLWMNIADARFRRRRLTALPLHPAKRRVGKLRLEDGNELWPLRAPSKRALPLHRMLLAEPAHLIYIANPGPLDAAIQRAMLLLSDVAHKEAIWQLGIERVTRAYATGLLLEDRSEAEVEAIAGSSDYYKFAVIYHPVARLIDIYQQRFVQLRNTLPQWPRLYELLAAVQGRSEPDCEAGISFRQFVTAITGGDFSHHLWQPQVRSLPWAESYQKLYRPDQLSDLEADLTRISGQRVSLEGVPVDAGLFTAPFASAARYADTPAGELPADPALWRGQLLDAALEGLIKGYYHWDFKLYNRTADKQPEETGA